MVDDCDGFDPGFEDVGRVTGIEGPRMGLPGGILPLRLFELLFEVCKSSVEVFFAHMFEVTPSPLLLVPDAGSGL